MTSNDSDVNLCEVLQSTKLARYTCMDADRRTLTLTPTYIEILRNTKADQRFEVVHYAIKVHLCVSERTKETFMHIH